jgi:hypothetical protein
MFKKEILFQIMSKDEKESLIRNNIYYLKKFYTERKEISKNEENLPQISENCEIVTVLKNSLFFYYNSHKNKYSNVENKWEEILDENNLDIVETIELDENLSFVQINEESVIEKEKEKENNVPLLRQKKIIIDDEDKNAPKNIVNNNVEKNQANNNNNLIKLFDSNSSKMMRQDSFQLLLDKVRRNTSVFLDIEKISLKILSPKNIYQKIKNLEEANYNSIIS